MITLPSIFRKEHESLTLSPNESLSHTCSFPRSRSAGRMVSSWPAASLLEMRNSIKTFLPRNHDQMSKWFQLGRCEPFSELWGQPPRRVVDINGALFLRGVMAFPRVRSLLQSADIVFL